jgi:hypothetical protein
VESYKNASVGGKQASRGGGGMTYKVILTDSPSHLHINLWYHIFKIPDLDLDPDPYQ